MIDDIIDSSGQEFMIMVMFISLAWLYKEYINYRSVKKELEDLKKSK